MQSGLKYGSSMLEKIDKFIDYFTKITKDEADFIENILEWDDETKIAFRLAKNIFEDNIKENNIE
jgi:hypothetical protein